MQSELFSQGRFRIDGKAETCVRPSFRLAAPRRKLPFEKLERETVANAHACSLEFSDGGWGES